MESKVSPDSIKERAAAIDKPAEPVTPIEKAEPVVPVEKSEVPATPVEKVEDKTLAKPADKVEDKVVAKPADTTPVEKPVEKKMPNDRDELRKWATKASQEAAEANRRVDALTKAIEKLSKKPVDYTALAKDPEALKKHIEGERAEAAQELEAKLTEAQNRATHNETVAERIKRETDSENYPEWKRVFGVIQTLVKNADGRINFNQPPADILDEAYKVALDISPASAPAAVATPAPAVAQPVAGGTMTQAEIDAKIAEGIKQGLEKANAATRAEAAGAGIGSQGKGGKRDTSVSKDAFEKMPMADLKAFIQKS